MPAGGARNRRLIRFVDQIFVHPLNRIVLYKISVISSHTDTKTLVSACKTAYLTVNVTQFTHTGSKLFRDLCKTRQLARLRGGQLYIAVGGRKVKLDWLCAAVLQCCSLVTLLPHTAAQLPRLTAVFPQTRKPLSSSCPRPGAKTWTKTSDRCDDNDGAPLPTDTTITVLLPLLTTSRAPGILELELRYAHTALWACWRLEVSSFDVGVPIYQRL